MRDERRHTQLPPPDGSDDRPDGFISLAILAFILVAPLIYFAPELGVIEAWLIDVYRRIDSWAAPIRELVFG
ncbi:MAG: hypothetical protein ABIL01_22825 [Pseudomonadota bacterium]